MHKLYFNTRYSARRMASRGDVMTCAISRSMYYNM